MNAFVSTQSRVRARRKLPESWVQRCHTLQPADCGDSGSHPPRAPRFVENSMPLAKLPVVRTQTRIERSSSSAMNAAPQVQHPLADVRVSAIQARALLEAVETAGVSMGTLLERAGLVTSAFADPYGAMTVAGLDLLTCLAVEMTGDPAFGLHWGERSPMFRFEVVALVVSQAPSLREGLGALLRCQAILGDHREFTLEETAFRVRLRVHPLAITSTAARVRTELGFAGFLRLLAYAGANRARDVKRIDFAYGPPPWTADHERVFGGGCRFRQRVSCIELDRAWLDRPLPNANLELHRVIIAEAERVLGRVHAASTCAEQLRRQVRIRLPELPSMAEVARTSGVSERSLRRRLAGEGTSYSELLQEIQCDVAESLLRDRRRSIQQVAFETGFQSVTSFHRAFKRRTGTSPAVYRASQALKKAIQAR
jgi:AraC-like DNA-binding protein